MASRANPAARLKPGSIFGTRTYTTLGASRKAHSASALSAGELPRDASSYFDRLEYVSSTKPFL